MKEDTLVVIWTSRDIDVAEKMVFMYTLNAKKQGWWENVIFLIWGPSVKLLLENEGLQEKLEQFKKHGITLKACKACSDQYGESGRLEELGVEVEYMGQPLTQYLKDGYKVITF